MKKFILAGTAIVCLFAASAAMATDDGAQIYKTRCQACHAADGSRAPAPGVAPLKGKSSDEIHTILMGYKNGTFGGAQKQVMHGITNQLSDDQLKSVADYSASL